MNAGSQFVILIPASRKKAPPPYQARSYRFSSRRFNTSATNKKSEIVINYRRSRFFIAPDDHVDRRSSL